MKWFVGGTVMLPARWGRAVCERSGAVQGGLLAIVEGPKRELAAMFERRGIHYNMAGWLTKECRLAPKGFVGSGWQRVLDSGAVDVDRPGVYVSRNLVSGDVIVEVLPDGSLERIARMDYDRGFAGRGLYAVALDPRESVPA